jgi:hypothetical protein
MANRYWVGGAGTWSSTTKWSTTSGGSSGASVPTSADDVIFDGSSGTGTASISSTANCASLTTTGWTGTITNTVGFGTNLNVYGNITIGSGTSWGTWSNCGIQILTNNSNVNFGGTTFPGSLTINLTSGNTVTLTGNLSIASTFTITR